MPELGDVTDRLRERLVRLRRTVEKKIPVREVKSEDKKKAATFAKRGRQEYNAGLYDLAAEMFEKAVKLDPRNQKSLYSLGNAYYKQRKVNEAVAKWHTCIDVEPQSAIAGRARRRVHHVAKTGVNLDEELRQLEKDLS
jgi:tetratricopeptide (TPR) repeat protein